MREDQNQYVQVETFIPGREYAIEGVLTAGKLTTLAVSKNQIRSMVLS
jgi:hypothetical protein